MREVYSHQDPTEVGYYKSILDEAGIVSYIRNDSAATQGLSGAAFFPILCVADEADYQEAIDVLKAVRNRDAAPGIEWKCPSCAEINPPNFELCWNCKTVRPAA